MNATKISKLLSALGIGLSLAFLAACSELDGLGLDPQILSFSANPSVIEKGESATLDWTIFGGSQDLSVTLTPGDIELSREGPYSVTPTETTTYTLTVVSKDRTVTKEATVSISGSSPGAEPACKTEDEFVPFKDSFFEAAVRRNLEEQGIELEPSGVSCVQIAELTTLSISSDPYASFSPDFGPVTDLSGIEYAVNLTELSLGNVLAPIKPLAKLSKLETIIFFYYLPDDLAALSGLANLTSFYAYALPYGENDISVLNDVPSLESVTLSGSNDGYPGTILDLGGIAALPNLVYLDIDEVQLKNPQGLKTLTNLNSLNLDYIVDTDDKLVEIRFSNEVVRAISELTRLETLNLSGRPVYYIYGENPSEVKNFSPLANLKRLQSLTLKEGVTNLSFITELSQLTNLNLSANQIGDISPLLNLPWAASDDTVDITFQNPAGDSSIPLIPAAQIEALSKVVKVLYSEKDVDTSDPSVACEARLITIGDDLLRDAVYDTLGLDEADDLSCTELKRLTSLDANFGITVQSEGIQSLSGLEYATNLIKLDLFSSGVQDFEPLSRLTKLEELIFGFSRSPSFELLSGLPRLRVLYLDSTGKADLSGIEALTSLEKLSLDLTDIEDISPLLELPWAGSNDFVSLQSVGDIPIEQIEALRQKVETVVWP